MLSKNPWGKKEKRSCLEIMAYISTAQCRQQITEGICGTFLYFMITMLTHFYDTGKDTSL